MSDIGYYVVTALFSVIVFFVGQFVARRTKRIKFCSLLALGLLLLKALLNHKPAWEATLFPFVNYIYFQSYWLYPIGLFFFGIAIPQLPIRWNRMVVAGVAVSFFGLSLWNERWMIFSPDDLSSERANAHHQCRQTTKYTCAPAACVSLLSYWGIDTTEGEMARLCRTREKGTSLFNIYRGLVMKTRPRPWKIRIVEMDMAGLRNMKKPAIIGGYHAVVVHVEDQQAVINDPLGGRPLRFSWEEFRQTQYFTGVAVVIEER